MKGLFSKLRSRKNNNGVSHQTSAPEPSQSHGQADKPAGRQAGPHHKGSNNTHRPPKKSSRQHPAKNKQGRYGSRQGPKPKKQVLSKQERHGDWSLSEFEVPVCNGKKRFHDFSLPDTLMHGIADLNFQYCTPIQGEVLESTLAGRDAIGKAQTGTGKTAAFLISVIKQLLEVEPPSPRYLGEPRAVIIAPTRELALQIADDAVQLTKYIDLNVINVVGGMDYDKQLKRLHADYVDILVATPGRLLDYVEKSEIHLDLVESLVIDEADRMLDMGFIPQVRRIVRATPRPGDRQTLLFSATFTDAVMRLGEQWTWQPVKVEIEPDSVATSTVDQKVYIVTNEDKYKLLRNLIQQENLQRVIVFANRRDQTRRLCDRLRKDAIMVDMLSGDVPQKKRVKTLDDFRHGRIQVLVATDVAGRGIHIDGISHVVNYTLPEDPEDYVHRIGRTGRAGATGISISFASEDDSFQIPALEKLLGEPICCEPPPEELLV